jgi:hypothetical protein
MTPTAYDDGPAGIACLGLVPEAQRDLLREVLAAGRQHLGPSWDASAARQEIFWINLWQRSGGAAPMALARASELDAWARDLAARAYAGTGAECDGYGFIINPVGSRAQRWHIDYNRDYSTIFIPLSRLTPENCTQYVVLPAGAPAVASDRAAANMDAVDLDALVDACDYVSVRQLLARPFSIIKMDFGTIHRGVANTGGFERIMFWISVNRRRDFLPVEPVIAVIR